MDPKVPDRVHAAAILDLVEAEKRPGDRNLFVTAMRMLVAEALLDERSSAKAARRLGCSSKTFTQKRQTYGVPKFYDARFTC
jgi:hypothetical protein